MMPEEMLLNSIKPFHSQLPAKESNFTGACGSMASYIENPQELVGCLAVARAMMFRIDCFSRGNRKVCSIESKSLFL